VLSFIHRSAFIVHPSLSSGIDFAIMCVSMMKRREAVLISNPNAGRGGERREREIAYFCESLRSRGVDVEVLNTRGPNDATRLAASVARDGARDVIVSGGDGTINEVLQGLVGTGARLAVWPRGTANVLARELKLPFEAERAAEVIARGQSKPVYVGCATMEQTGAQRYFFLMAGIGLDASIVSHVRPRLKRRVGEAAFWYAGFGHLARWQPVFFNVEVDGQTLRSTFATIGKAAHYGGNLAITPRAQLDKPEFEVCIVASKSRLRFLYLLSHAMRREGVAENSRGVQFIRTTRARVVGDVLVQIDGELTGQLPMTFEIAQSSIEIITP
jgi:YegS/Rv2252/BmrU family lipid kinase